VGEKAPLVGHQSLQHDDADEDDEFMAEEGRNYGSWVFYFAVAATVAWIS
jgi:hypothetical protein